MAANQISKIPNLFTLSNEITQEYYLKHYIELMVPYIGKGRPSEDTKNSYESSIKQYLKWCSISKLNPFQAKEMHILRLRKLLYEKGYRQASINLKLVAIHQFYRVAVKLGLISENPTIDIQCDDPERDKRKLIRFLTAAQLQELAESIIHEEGVSELIRQRNMLMILLMATEGLRTVEVHRLSLEHINFNANVILIKGKGHDDFIYPSNRTMECLNRYIEIVDKDLKEAEHDNFGRPIFLSQSHNSQHCRLTRLGIRYVINNLLKRVGLKQKHLSCHMLRHTCGTLLYEQTKDLQIVKETLRHRDLKQASRYAHIQNRMLRRYTSAIPLFQEK